MAYDYSILYLAGKDIPEADALSISRFGQKGEVNAVFDDLQAGIHWQAEYGVTWEQLISETNNDRLLRRIKERVVAGNWDQVCAAEVPFKKIVMFC